MMAFTNIRRSKYQNRYLMDVFSQLNKSTWAMKFDIMNNDMKSIHRYTLFSEVQIWMILGHESTMDATTWVSITPDDGNYQYSNEQNVSILTPYYQKKKNAKV